MNEIEEARNLVLQAFDRACAEELTDETKDEALCLVRLYLDNPNLTIKSPLFGMMTGFLLGIGEGMRIIECLDKIRTATPTDESKDCRLSHATHE